MVLTNLTRYRDAGILLLRVGFGIAFILHGFPLVWGGPGVWFKLGSGLGMPVPTVFGAFAAFGEFLGGILLLAGFLFRPACVWLLCVMLGALAFHLKKGDDFNTYSHALEAAIVFASLIFIGPGKYSIDGN